MQTLDGKFIAAIALVGLFLMFKKDGSLPRGLRVNNPGNIKEFHKHYIDWKGEHPDDIDKTLEEFTGIQWGYRAIGRVLDTYWNTHGVRTVRQFVARYAPPVENLTESYIAHVAQLLGVDPDAEIDLQARKLDLVKAITKHEQGFIPNTDEFIKHSLLLA